MGGPLKEKFFEFFQHDNLKTIDLMEKRFQIYWKYFKPYF